jgi:hypothetical protein
MRCKDDSEEAYLVVKATVAIEVVEKCRVGLTSPEVHIGNLKIAPNCLLIDQFFKFLVQELSGDTNAQ